MEKKTRLFLFINVFLAFLLVLRLTLPLAKGNPDRLIVEDKKSIGYITINDSIVLRKNDNNIWEISEDGIYIPADNDKVERFITILTSLDNSTPVSRDNNSGLMGDNPFKVAIGAGLEKTSTLLIGRTASVPGQRYVMLKGSPVVYRTEGSAGFYAGQPASFWKERSPLYTTAPADILLMRYTSDYSKSDYVFAQVLEDKQQNWILRTGSNVKSYAPEDAVKLLLPITEAKADDVLPLHDKNPADIASWYVETKKGIKRFLFFKSGDKICLREEGTDYYFYDVAGLFSALEEADFAR